LIAKEKNLFKDLSKEIIKKAVNDYKLMLVHNPKLKISVNLDLDILHDKEFFNWLLNYIESSNLPKFQFGIEVTENSKYAANSDLNSLFKILHNYGINVYMDDFSMGHTSIKFLQDTLFDYVKLDGSLVKNLDNERCQNIIESIIKLGNSLNFEVIAEFVETEEQKSKLADMGCYIYQGYLYYKAIPFNELISILKNKVN
jgi:EAL domain-containing protein (putative c-di-GMP-specific phosphodiesterase class I)